LGINSAGNINFFTKVLVYDSESYEGLTISGHKKMVVVQVARVIYIQNAYPFCLHVLYISATLESLSTNKENNILAAKCSKTKKGQQLNANSMAMTTQPPERRAKSQQ
jgi:hypothetical protein